MDVKAYMQQVGQAARDASRATARASTAAKNTALLVFAKTDKDPHHPKVTPALLTALLAESGLDVVVARTAGEVTCGPLMISRGSPG